MKMASTLLAGSALVFATGAFAQDMTAQEPSDEAASAAESKYTDAQIEKFAAAVLKMQELEGGVAANQDKSRQIIAESGLDQATFNSISTEMRSDSDLVERVKVAAMELQSSDS